MAMASGPKISYPRWQYGRMLLQRLRNGKHNHTLTEVSRLVKGNGDTPGWAASALEHRGVMGERDIVAMEKLLVEKPSGMGRQPGDTMLNQSQRDEYKRLLKRLREEFGWTREQIAHALGYGTVTSVNKAISQGGGTVAKLSTLSQIVNAIGVAPGVAEEPEPNMALSSPKARPVEARSGLEAQLSAVKDSAYAFLDELMKLEEFMPQFARAPLLDYQQRVESIITELGVKK